MKRHEGFNGGSLVVLCQQNDIVLRTGECLICIEMQVTKAQKVGVLKNIATVCHKMILIDRNKEQ